MKIALPSNKRHALSGLRGQPLPNVYAGLLPPVTRAMEVTHFKNLLKRQETIYPDQKESIFFDFTSLDSIFEEEGHRQDLNLDDGVMNTYFQVWMDSQIPSCLILLPALYQSESLQIDSIYRR